ncbi:MAG: type II toxin-antitoxin system HicB family antitoxin [Candidatus Thermoplasmatota archaeon]|nr:type II toxin-antitoxin system HicB family antitoxin [Candidatus Thermoplasmatota archaeon]MDP7265049.1 type II toxin-antitoxin system HicB family antitoxin [Candidatus Thermoplasmatota archaeon]
MNFKVVIQQDEDSWYIATVPSLPGCISQGKTEDEALENIREAIELHVACLAEDGVPLRRDENIKEVLLAVSI